MPLFRHRERSVAIQVHLARRRGLPRRRVPRNDAALASSGKRPGKMPIGLSHLRHSIGFTLIELLVVVAIVAMASAGVGFALRDSSQVQLERDAERLAALLESARARSRVSGLPVRWHATPDGFQFEGLPPSGQTDSDLPERWLDDGTHVVEGEGATQATILLLGPEPIIEPQAVILESRTQPGKTVRVATDGVRPFALQAVLP